MVVKSPDGHWVVRWIVGVVLNVQSTSAACAEKGVFGSKWTTWWARFCDAGRVPSGLVGVVGVVGARGGSCPVVACAGCQLVRALLPRLFLLSGGNCDHRGATRRRHAVTGVLW